ncbi:translation initiation factor IF-2-like [Microtus oregoni]|uniref:translation initiation factor IF-2-like n=1 Tax=Microtus oregoni TaxID=111838 RepID=UPI001BB140CF|nr:translation initiation factor IF-2-like [Microtus oregoni]
MELKINLLFYDNSEVSTPESLAPFLRGSGDRSPKSKRPGLQGSASLFPRLNPGSRAGRPSGSRPSTGVRGAPGDQGAARGLRPQGDSAAVSSHSSRLLGRSPPPRPPRPGPRYSPEPEAQPPAPRLPSGHRLDTHVPARARGPRPRLPPADKEAGAARPGSLGPEPLGTRRPRAPRRGWQSGAVPRIGSVSNCDSPGRQLPFSTANLKFTSILQPGKGMGVRMTLRLSGAGPREQLCPRGTSQRGPGSRTLRAASPSHLPGGAES